MAQLSMQLRADCTATNYCFEDCTKYAPDPRTSYTKRHCGDGNKNHNKALYAQYTSNQSPDDLSSTLANKETCSSASSNSTSFRPTNVFGRVLLCGAQFFSQRPTEFLRISNEDQSDNVLALMLSHWNLMSPTKPGLCIALVGSKVDLLFNESKKAAFVTGIIQATEAIDAWIITCGLNAGILNLVDEASKQGHFCNFQQRQQPTQLRCIGIAPWGCVANRDQLLCVSYGVPVRYNSPKWQGDDQPAWLHPAHTHCIFVNDGRRKRYDDTEVLGFLANLCSQISLSTRESGLGIPTVLVVIGDGYDVLLHARESVLRGVPLVVCTGTGTASDLIGLAFTYRAKYRMREFKNFDAEEKSTLKQMLLDVSGVQAADDALEMLTQTVMNEQLITIFDMNKSDDLHVAVLYALIKVNSRMSTQLKLALSWNRIDIARDKIFANSPHVDPESLEPIMMDALLENKTEFVGLLLQNGICMRKFLTVERLHRLYNESSARECFAQLLAHYKLYKTLKQLGITRTPKDLGDRTEISADGRCEDTVYLTMVSSLSRKMLGRFSHCVYELDTPEMYEDPNQLEQFGGYTFLSPFQELFLWAVYHQRQTMALFFWERSEDTIILALIACVLYSRMKKTVPIYESETLHLYDSYIVEFEMLAIRILEECNAINPALTALLIEREAPIWGGYSCLSLAKKAVRRKFISTTACQSALKFAWSHGIQGEGFCVITAAFCPLLLLSDRCLKFTDNHVTATAAVGHSNLNSGSSGKAYNFDFILGSSESLNQQADGDKKQSRGTNKPPFPQKFTTLYTAPRTKFLMDCCIYVAFLLYFTYTLVFRIVPTEITMEEAILMAYFTGLFIDVLRQISLSSDLQNENFPLWLLHCPCLQLDTAVILLSASSMVLRIWKARTFIIARTCYAITMILCYMRVFRLYGLHPALGPKMVMIQRMLTELTLFSFILLIILVAYGGAMQSLLFPYRTSLDWTVVKDIFYYPYWNLYGELHLDHIIASNDTCKGENNVDICPSYNFVVPVLLAFYMLFASILLLNLLIAIFSNVFQQVEEQSIEIWKFNTYAFVVEYSQRPILPVPFSTPQALAELTCYLFQLCLNKFKRRPEGENGPKLPVRGDVHKGAIRSERNAVTHTTGRIRTDEGVDLFAFARRKTNQRGEKRSPDWRTANVDDDPRRATPESATLLEGKIIDEEMRMARLFEVHCTRNFLNRQRTERTKTIAGGISHIQSKMEEISERMSQLLNRMETVQQTAHVRPHSISRLRRFPERMKKSKSETDREERNVEQRSNTEAATIEKLPCGSHSEARLNISPPP